VLWALIDQRRAFVWGSPTNAPRNSRLAYLVRFPGASGGKCTRCGRPLSGLLRQGMPGRVIGLGSPMGFFRLNAADVGGSRDGKALLRRVTANPF